MSGLKCCASGAHRVLLRVAPPIPRPLDRGIDELQPLVVCRAARRGWQREHLPPPFVAHHGHDRLTARPSDVPVGPRVLRVGGHEALLDREDEVVRGTQALREAAADRACLAGSEARGSPRGALVALRVVIQMQRLDLVQQRVGLREQRSSARLAGRFLSWSRGGCDHCVHHNRCRTFVKYRFTAMSEPFGAACINKQAWRAHPRWS